MATTKQLPFQHTQKQQQQLEQNYSTKEYLSIIYQIIKNKPSDFCF